MRAPSPLLGGLLCALCLALPGLAQVPQQEAVSSTQILRFNGVGIGEMSGGLIWRGGIVMSTPNDQFGGMSGFGFTSTEQHVAAVTDRGNFISGQLIYDEAGVPFSLVGVQIEPIQNSRGVELPRAYTRDAEALAVILREGAPAAVRVGFENLTRVADFELVESRPAGPAKEVAVPEWLTDTRTNESLEAVCIAPPASPIAGSTLLLTEGVIDDDGQHVAWLLGRNDRGPLSYETSSGVNPTDCAFLPNGDLLVLERGVSLFVFTMQLKRIPAGEVRPGALMRGEVLLESTGGDIDNMEALAVHTAPDGGTRITLVSDNNFNDWERNLLLEFSLPDGGIQP